MVQWSSKFLGEARKYMAQRNKFFLFTEDEVKILAAELRRAAKSLPHNPADCDTWIEEKSRETWSKIMKYRYFIRRTHDAKWEIVDRRNGKTINVFTARSQARQRLRELSDPAIAVPAM